MTHTNTEQRSKENQEALDTASFFAKYGDAPSAQASHHLKRLVARVQELEASQAQRVALSEVMDLVSEWGMASHCNGEAALDAHSPDATPEEIAYADECVQRDREAWKAIEDKLRAHGITQEKQ